MIARKRTVLGIIGMIIAGCFSVLCTGCGASAKATATFKKGPHSIWFDSEEGVHYQYEFLKSIYHFDNLSCFDLDTKDYDVITFQNQDYKYFYNIDCLYQEESQKLVLHDDPCWDTYFEGELTNPQMSSSMGYTFYDDQERELKGAVSFTIETGLNIYDAPIELTVNLNGGAFIPMFDSSRWESLERKMYLVRDGVTGSPDPVIMDLSGKACDVFGYLYEAGITQGQTSIEGEEWTMIIDSSGQFADVYVDNTWFSSITLN